MIRNRFFLILVLVGLSACSAQRGGSASQLQQLSQRVSRLEATRASGIERQAARQPLSTLSETIVDLSAEASKSVVEVIADPSVVTNSGTGFIYNREGIILTNDHLVHVHIKRKDGTVKKYYKDKITIKLYDGRTLKGQLIGVDPDTDLAAIQVEAGNLPPPLPLATRRVQQGELAFSIGHPRGLPFSVEWRPISNPYRVGSLSGTLLHQIGRGFFLGNSGGPVIDLQGRVIGMVYSTLNVREKTNPDKTVVYAAIGWAIPAETMAKVAPEMIHGKYRITGFVRE